MSDYMFMLDSHLTAEQSKAVAAVRDGAESANLNLFLTGGAMRDMMGGFAIRDLDFTVEGGTPRTDFHIGNAAGGDMQGRVVAIGPRLVSVVVSSRALNDGIAEHVTGSLVVT